MDCEFFNDGVCGVASRMAKRDVQTNPSACKYCLTHKNPKSENKVTASLAIGSSEGEDQQILFEIYGKHLKTSAKKEKRKPSPGGPGTELIRLIKAIATKKICSRCTSLAYDMDRLGCGWVKENREDILDQMAENAKKLKMPFVRPVVSRLIGIACWKAKKKGLCGGFT